MKLSGKKLCIVLLLLVNAVSAFAQSVVQDRKTSQEATAQAEPLQSFVFLAEGFEEIEALATVDVLRRGGMDVRTVSINDSREVTGRHGVTVKADQTFGESDFDRAEWLILPGGMPGARNLRSSDGLCTLLRKHYASNGRIAAICASPAVVLATLGILEGKEAVCYPGFEDLLVANGAIRRDAPVVVLDKLITANGPASSLRFALAILAKSVGQERADKVARGMLL